MFRTALTGAHLLLTGELVTDVRVTAREHGIDGIDDLVETKLAGERTALAPDAAESWRKRVGDVFDLLERARQGSVLPDEPANADELDAWLVAIRRAR